MGDSSDEEYRDGLQKYTERVIKKVGRKNPISRSQQYQEEVKNNLKNKHLFTSGSESSDDDEKIEKKTIKKKERSSEKHVEDKTPKRRGRPPKATVTKSKSRHMDSDSEVDCPPKRARKSTPVKSSGTKASKSKRDLDSGSDSEIDMVKPVKKAIKKERVTKKERDESDMEGSTKSEKSMYFDWAPEEGGKGKPVTRLEQHLGYGNKLILCHYKNRNSIHFRKYSDGKPTKYGITLPLTYLDKIKGAIEMAETHARVCGSLEEKKNPKSG